jgi:hypothetical protein
VCTTEAVRLGCCASSETSEASRENPMVTQQTTICTFLFFCECMYQLQTTLLCPDDVCDVLRSIALIVYITYLYKATHKIAIITQLIKTSQLLCNPIFNKNTQLNHILIQLIRVHKVTPYFSNVHFNIILPSTSIYSFMFPDHNCL